MSPGVIQCHNEYKKFFCCIHNFMFFFLNISYVWNFVKKGTTRSPTSHSLYIYIHTLPFHFLECVKIWTYMTLFHWVLSAQSAWYIICTVRLSDFEGFTSWTLSTSAWQFSLWFSVWSLMMPIWMAMLSHNQPVHPGKGHPKTCPLK